MANPNIDKKDSKLEGEGSRSAGQHYRDAATRHAEGGKSEKAAQEAKRALERTGEDLAEAERQGKKGPARGDAE